MRLKWLVLVHLRYVSLVILVLYASFVCFQVLRAQGARKCILRPFGAFLGMDWIAYPWSQSLDEFEGLIFTLDIKQRAQPILSYSIPYSHAKNHPFHQKQSINSHAKPPLTYMHPNKANLANPTCIIYQHLYKTLSLHNIPLPPLSNLIHMHINPTYINQSFFSYYTQMHSHAFQEAKQHCAVSFPCIFSFPPCIHMHNQPSVTPIHSL